MSCILCHRSIQLILAYSWTRPAILAAGKGRGGMFLFLLFLHCHSSSSFSPVPLFHLLYYLSSFFLWETTQNDPQGLGYVTPLHTPHSIWPSVYCKQILWKRPDGRVVRATDFWSQSPGLKSLYWKNSAYDCMALYCTEPYIMSLWSSSNNSLTFTTLWAFSADDRLMIFFLFFPENRIWHFMQIVSLGDNLHEMSNPVFWEK